MQKPSWKIRRRIINTTLLFCASCVTYIMIFGDDRAVNEVIVLGAFGLAFGTIGSYVFGAVWDDSNFMATSNKQGQDTNPVYEEQLP